jgi:hypothetical protein
VAYLQINHKATTRATVNPKAQPITNRGCPAPGFTFTNPFFDLHLTGGTTGSEHVPEHQDRARYQSDHRK